MLGTLISLPLFGKEIQLADIFFVFIAITLLFDLRKVRGIRALGTSAAVIYSLVFLIAFLLAASILSPDKTMSLAEFSAILYLIILYLWIAGIDMDKSQLKSLLHIWLYFSGGLCILALSGFLFYTLFAMPNWFVQVCPDMKSLIPFARLTATFPTMNMFASFLHVGIVFLLTLIVYEKRRISYTILACLIFLCAFLTASRNLLGIFVTASLFIFPVRGRPVLRVFKYISLGLTILLIFLVLVTTIWCIFPVRPSLSFNTSPSLYAVLNRVSVRFIKEDPLVGIGPGMFNRTLIKQVNWDEVKDTYRAKGLRDKNIAIDPHNTYLGWAGEAGLPFITAMIFLFYGIMRFLQRGHRACAGSFEGNFCYACFCGMLGFMVNAFYIDIFTMRHFWVMLGLGTLAAAHCVKGLKDKDALGA